jgi:hypothetical protein
MTWLSENYKWLFDGIGALVVMAVLGYIVRRVLQDRQKGTAVLTAQGAKVMNSPVASGSGITQTINSPTINLSFPAASAPSTPVRFFNYDGNSGPLNVSGRQHSVQDPSLVDLWCLVTIVNCTLYPMKIAPSQLFLNGAEWLPERIFFRLKSDPLPKYERISLVGNHKEDYQLHFMFPVANCPKAISGYLLVEVETDSGNEPFQIDVKFP